MLSYFSQKRHENIIYLNPLSIKYPKYTVTVFLGNGFLNPGIYEVSSDNTFADIINKYPNKYNNGFSSNLNLDSKVYDGQNIILVPNQNANTLTHNNINNPYLLVGLEQSYPKKIQMCTIDDFKKAKGVGDKMATLVLDYVKSNPDITNAGELVQIKGIGDKTANEISKFCN